MTSTRSHPVIKNHYSKTEKNELKFAKKIRKLVLQDKYSDIYSYFDTNVTSDITLKQFIRGISTTKKLLATKVRSSKIKTVETFRKVAHLHSIGVGEPASGEYIQFIFITSYKRSAVKTELDITLARGSHTTYKIKGFNYYLLIPKSQDK